MTILPEYDDQAVVSAILREDIGAFVVKAFQTLSPGDQYLHNWHVDAVVHHLCEVRRGRIRRLIITLPPRSLKSICVSVALPAWWLGHDPGMRFICASYSTEFAATLARQFRAVVTSDWYQALFPLVRISKDTETELETTKGGGRVAVAVGGSLTGRGAHVIIIDDPMKADDAKSDKARGAVNDWFRTTLLSRLDNKETGAIILVVQRLHEDDLAGRLIEDGDWNHLNLPAIASEDQDIPIGPGTVYHRQKDEVLHPTRESLAVLEKMRGEMGSLTFSAQYLQQPVPAEGIFVKREWISWYDVAPAPDLGVQVVQSWDVASATGKHNDWSVCSTWAIIGRDYYLLDIWRGRRAFADLRRQVVALARLHTPQRILIEETGPGLYLIRDLRANPTDGVPQPIAVRPEGDKRDRMAAQSARFEAGQVYLPKEAPWLAEFLHEILAFPNTRHDDQVDSVSQLLNWAESQHLFEPLVSVYIPKFFVGE